MSDAGGVAVESSPAPQVADDRKAADPSEKDSAEEKHRQYFQEELRRLQKGLQKESSRIQDPGLRPHIPYVFNSLTPYYETSLVSEVIEKPPRKPDQYNTRNTAIGLVDPWVNHTMDCELLPTTKVKDPAPFRKDPKKEPKEGHGSTIIPNFPAIKMELKELETRQLVYSDVPMLREELRQKYSSQAQDKINQDYENTKNDFRRMELHKLGQVHPMNQRNMRQTYFAYLQNSPGSKKALKECVKGLPGGPEKAKKKEEEEAAAKEEEAKTDTAPAATAQDQGSEVAEAKKEDADAAPADDAAEAEEVTE